MLIQAPPIPGTEEDFNIPNILAEKAKIRRQIIQDEVLECDVCGSPLEDCECTIKDSMRSTLVLSYDRQKAYMDMQKQ